MLLSIAPTFLADFDDTNYLFTQAGSNTDQKITDEFTLIALVKNSEEGVCIREPSDFESCRFWMVNKKFPKVVDVDITAKCIFKNHHTLHIKHDRLLEVCGKIQEIIDFGTLTQNITSLCGFFNLNPETVARINLYHVQLEKRSKSVPPYTVLTKLIAFNEAETVLVLYCKSEDGFMPSSFVDKQSPSSFDCHGKTYYLMAYVSIDTSGNATHYVRFDKNTLKFQSKDCISPYTTPPHAPFEESKCYVWMYIADSCNDQIKMSSLKNSVSYITQDFESIVDRFGPHPFTTTNLVTVVIDGVGSVVKDPTPESLIANNSDPPQIFVEIVNRSGNDRKYNYSDCIPPNYFLMAILQQHTLKSRSKGSSNIRKIWFRKWKEDTDFINVPSPNEKPFQWDTVSKSILSEGVVFVYRLDETW